ncbi:MAG: adenylate/guanylate cyclase domain-containing protein [Betaproteobacteria bacterium]
MTQSNVRQRLAAILAADVSGFSRLMQADEAATMAALDAARSIFKSQIEARQGRIMDMAGDSVFAVFDTATGAVETARSVQELLNATAGALPQQQQMRFRIGVHLGDVMERTDGTVFGDGVNIAARLEALAEPGGIVVSDAVQGAVRGKVEARFDDQGEQHVKNIAHPVRAYRWVAPDGDALIGVTEPVARLDMDKPSIAVLPFHNFSDDPDQAYFADGIAEDLLTALSRYRWLMVIGRISSFSFRGRSPDVRQVGRELGVRHVVEGSVRKSGNRIRISAQLIDAASGKSLWAERFDRDFADVLQLQDEIALIIAGAIEPQLSRSEQERARRKPVDNLDAWDLYQRGLWHYWQYSKDASAQAQQHFAQAIALDPQFAAAHAFLAYSHFTGSHQAFEEAHHAQLLARDGALCALAIDDKEPLAHLVLGRVLAGQGDFGSALAELQTAAALNPSFSLAHYALASVQFLSGHHVQALAGFEAAARLSPIGPVIWGIQTMHANTLAAMGDFVQAEVLARAATRHQTATFWVYANWASILGNLGRFGPATAALTRLREMQPDFSEAFYDRLFVGIDPAVRNSYFRGLYLAGLPQGES